MSEKETCCSNTSNTKSSLMVSILCCAVLFIFVVGYVGKIQAVASDNAARIEMMQQRLDQMSNQVAEMQKLVMGAAPTASAEQPAPMPGAAPEAAAPAMPGAEAMPVPGVAAPAPEAAAPAMPSAEPAMPAAPAAPAAPATTNP